MLDVGCAGGEFLLEAAAAYGVVPCGIDVAARPLQGAREAGLDVAKCELHDAPLHFAECALITAIDLIEHVAAPHAFLRDAAARLRPGGVLYVETPNIRSTVYAVGRVLSANTLGRPDAIVDRLFPPEHVQYFTPASLARLVTGSVLRLVDLSNRRIPYDELATTAGMRIGLSLLQAVDSLRGTHIITCAVLQRPRTPDTPA